MTDKPTKPEPKKILILECADCGHELNRTDPLTKYDAYIASMNARFNAGKCPNGCRSTFSDLNLNTKITEISA